jgi:hypothetical protein
MLKSSLVREPASQQDSNRSAYLIYINKLRQIRQSRDVACGTIHAQVQPFEGTCQAARHKAVSRCICLWDCPRSCPAL